MAEELVAELCVPRGFADVHAVLNCAARLSRVLLGELDCGHGKQSVGGAVL